MLNMIETIEDSRDFETVYKTYRKQMYVVAKKILESDVDAEDAVHDVFAKIAAKHMAVIRGLRDDQELRYYLLVAVKNTSINMVKRKSRTELTLDDMSHGAYLHENLIIHEDFLGIVSMRSDYEKVMEALRTIKDTYREVLYLYFVLDLSVHEIAAILDRNLLTVKKQVTRGKKMLYQLLNEKGVLYLDEKK